MKLVFEPIKINNVEIPNRIVRTAHETMFTMGPVNDDLINYHVTRARGGVGLTITEMVSVHYSGVGTGPMNLDDSAVGGFKRLTSAVKPYGMRMFMQLWHPGHCWVGFSPEGFYHQGAPWGASAVPNPFSGFVPVAMSVEQIKELTAAFAAAAKRARESGFDGLEVHAAHGYLFYQFLSSMTNRRKDEYGGSIENRARFLREVLRAIRNACGTDYPLGVRVSASVTPKVLSESEVGDVVRLLDGDHLIDFVDVSYSDHFSIPNIVRGMDAPAGYELPSASQITAVTKVPRIVIGRFGTLDEAEQVLREGTADLVGMVRATIADPEIVKKTREGRVDEVRPCIACNQGCYGGLYTAFRMGCTVNPAVGEEAVLDESLITATPKPGKVVVIGGGPAGMEAARIAALRGHNVVLAEARKNLGGQVNVAKQAPNLQGIGDITDWLQREVKRLGVEVRLNTYMDAEDVRAEKPDAVIVATGAEPRMDGVQAMNPGEIVRGIDMPHVMSPTDLFTGSSSRVRGSHAFIYDDVGHYEALAAAEFLIDKGMAVTFATRLHTLSYGVIYAARMEPVLERLRSKGSFRLITYSYVVEIEPTTVRVAGIRSTGSEIIQADTVVMVLHKNPVREVYDNLRGTVSNLYLIGDALAPRDLRAAIHDGHMIGRRVLSTQDCKRFLGY